MTSSSLDFLMRSSHHKIQTDIMSFYAFNNNNKKREDRQCPITYSIFLLRRNDYVALLIMIIIALKCRQILRQRPRHSAPFFS